ncbi:MAG: glycosyltransferase family 2 protein [Pirellulales bacterium]|nr:glycosyltransferase family 2 protein [Pirellulales bacterium]
MSALATISIVIPVYNEVETLPRLYDALAPVLKNLGRDYEVLLIDDGSRDGSWEVLCQLAARDAAWKVIRFRRNYGQTAAMNAGLHEAAGEIIITMDADLQNDPADIPLLIAKLEQGYDLVHGWRKDRQDTWLTRKIPSRLANWLISRVTGFPIHDLGCTLKAIRREIAQDLELYGEMHRFIPILAHWRGANCAEIVTRHHPRRYGTSKYGLSRTVRVVLDLITVKYLTSYMTSPMKLFGRFGLLSFVVMLLAGLGTAGMKVFGQVDMTGNPLLLLTVFAGFVGMQFLVLGMLGELGVRTYYESQEKTYYTVRTRLNMGGKGALPELRVITMPRVPAAAFSASSVAIDPRVTLPADLHAALMTLSKHGWKAAPTTTENTEQELPILRRAA